MIKDIDLRELIEFDEDENAILSLYLNVDPRTRTIEQYKLALRSLFDSIDNVTAADRERIERFVNLEYDRQASSVICFSGQTSGFWRVYTFDVPTEDAIMLDRRPLVRRLVELIDTYGHLGVVAVDKNGARFFTFHMGSLTEAEGMLGEEVRRHKQGGRSAARYQRHEDEIAMANLRAAAEQTEILGRQYGWRRLVVAGTDTNVARFLDLLSPPTRSLVVGTTPLEITAGIQEVRERAEAVAINSRARYIQQLASDLIVAAGKGNNAVIDLDPTVEAIQSNRVYQLLFSETYEVDDLQRCQTCSYLSSNDNERCPVCGGVKEHVPDAINTLARRALAQDAHVIILPAENPLVQAGHNIGAFLRF